MTSPPLFRRLVTGQVIPSVELVGRKPGTNPQVFLRFCFQNVQVTSIQQSDSAGATVPPKESSLFFYGSVSEQYFRQNPDGTIAPGVFAGWNSTNGTLITTYPATCGN